MANGKLLNPKCVARMAVPKMWPSAMWIHVSSAEENTAMDVFHAATGPDAKFTYARTVRCSTIVCVVVP